MAVNTIEQTWAYLPSTPVDRLRFCPGCEVCSMEVKCWLCGQQMDAGKGKEIFQPSRKAMQNLVNAHTHFSPENPGDYKQLPYQKYDWNGWLNDRTVQEGDPYVIRASNR